MLIEIILAIVQAATEFLPISSSGHLALLSNIISEPNIFLFTTLHLASLLAVIIFTRREILFLLRFSKQARRLWGYLLIATIPAALVGFLLNGLISSAFSSYLFLSIAFFFTGFVLLFTKNSKEGRKLNLQNSFTIGLFQILALFPGVSRSGMTISAGLFSGIEKERAARFSFLLFIPLSIGAFVFELKEFYFSIDLLVAFILCLILSLIFLNLLMKIIKNGKFWLFSVYCFAIGILSLIIYLTS